MRRLVVPVLVLLALGALGCKAEDSGCTSSSGDMDMSAPTQTASIDPPAPVLTTKDVAIIDSLVAFMRAPNAGTFADVPFADEVTLGLGRRLYETHAARELVDPRAWEVDKKPYFRAGIGPFSALEWLARHDQPLTRSRGAYLRCASAPHPPPRGVASLRRLSIRPAKPESCGFWFSVDVFVTPEGEIAAVTLDLYEV